MLPTTARRPLGGELLLLRQGYGEMGIREEGFRGLRHQITTVSNLTVVLFRWGYPDYSDHSLEDFPLGDDGLLVLHDNDGCVDRHCRSLCIEGEVSRNGGHKRCSSMYRAVALRENGHTYVLQ